MRETFLTVLSTPSYLPGVVILYMSLKKVSHKAFHVLCRKDLPKTVFTVLDGLEIPYICEEDDVFPAYILKESEQTRKTKFGDWENTFFKIKMFELMQFDKICYLDSDMIITSNIDELFNFPHMSAVPDRDFYRKESDAFNSGVLVFVPEKEVQTQIQPILKKFWQEGPYPFGDQDIVSKLYPDWILEREKHLDVKYNAAVSRLHLYPKEISPKVLHYANHYKPWDMKYGYFARICFCILKRRFKAIRAVCWAYLYNIKSQRAINNCISNGE